MREFKEYAAHSTPYLLVWLFLFLSGCSTFSASTADPDSASLNIPLGITLQSVNDAMQQNFLIGAERTISLEPGPQRLEFWYQQSFGSPAMGRQETLRSTLQRVEFVAQAGQHYRLDYMRPGTASLAKQSLPEMTFSLLDQQGKIVAQALSIQTAPTPSPVLDAASHTLRKTTPKQSPPSAPTHTEQPSDTGALPPEHEHLSQLKALWKTTPEAEREAFLRWILR